MYFLYKWCSAIVEDCYDELIGEDIQAPRKSWADLAEEEMLQNLENEVD